MRAISVLSIKTRMRANILLTMLIIIIAIIIYDRYGFPRRELIGATQKYFASKINSGF